MATTTTTPPLSSFIHINTNPQALTLVQELLYPHTPKSVHTRAGETSVLAEFVSTSTCVAAFNSLSARGLSCEVLTNNNVASVITFNLDDAATEVVPEDYGYLVTLTHTPSLFESLHSSCTNKNAILRTRTHQTSRSLLFEICHVPQLLTLLLNENPYVDPNECYVKNDQQPPSKMTPLFKLVARKDIECVQLLLKHPKTDVNAPSVISGQAETPLLKAINVECTALTQALLKHPNIDVNHGVVLRTTKRCITPLIKAVEKNDPDIVKLILDHPQVQLNDRLHPKRARNLAGYLLARQNENPAVMSLFSAAVTATWDTTNHLTCPINVQLKAKTFLQIQSLRSIIMLPKECLFYILAMLPMDSEQTNIPPEPVYLVHFFYHPPPSKILFVKIQCKGGRGGGPAAAASAPPAAAAGQSTTTTTNMIMASMLQLFQQYGGPVSRTALLQNQPTTAGGSGGGAREPEEAMHMFAEFGSKEHATNFLQAWQTRTLAIPQDVKDMYVTYKATLGSSCGLSFWYDTDQTTEDDIQALLDSETLEDPTTVVPSPIAAQCQGENAREFCIDQLSLWTTDDDLSALCSPFGQVESVHIQTNPANGRSLGTAFVKMAKIEEARKACQAIHRKTVANRKIVAGYVGNDGNLYPIAYDDALCYQPNGQAYKRTPTGEKGALFRPDTLDIPLEVLSMEHPDHDDENAKPVIPHINAITLMLGGPPQMGMRGMDMMMIMGPPPHMMMPGGGMMMTGRPVPIDIPMAAPAGMGVKKKMRSKRSKGRRRDRATAAGACHICGEQGHFMAACPQNPKRTKVD